ncbi:peptide methionine sulfoxide reductase, partial [Pantoea ananatis]|uniref:peptide-methionine (S)-S-oxide reductase n=1 Tax=Pantoea ananas TaxID=553 RepID=UPI00079C560C
MAIEYAVIAGGCFWCTEAVFKDVIGVESVESGYTGGARPNPTYEQVCSGATGHAEAIRIGFDPETCSY